MNYRRLGRTGLEVSELCFGTMSFGGDADETMSGAMYAACRDAGINFFDCANMYEQGRSEEILGRLIAHERDNLIITTKCYAKTSDDRNSGGLNRRSITRAIEDSLKRLKTDRVEVLFMHKWDDKTPLEETLRAVENVIQSGKVLHLGLSNFAAWQVMQAHGIASRHGWSPVEIIQPMYNLVKRQAETEILPMASAMNIAVIPYGPAGGGFLTGKYTRENMPDQGRLIANTGYARRYDHDWMYDVAADFSEFAKSKGVHPVTLAVAWVKHNPAVTAPIIGARNTDQLRASLAAADFEMTEELYDQLCGLTRQPPLATDRAPGEG